ncbi:T9SS type B sorting domain-containing protein [Winogradskyella flava]|uniref:T9SS type B sorting domain-containing protein n=1 Tax=Winogradskyella flava TaxID=1884876 RepID=UPI00248F5AC1|nr:T9SS type B sorting domain-containing protein [Winogradskyella flava]
MYLLYYPGFFTPNGDGDSDYWQIKNSEVEPLSKLFIYDRYGKLITELRPNDSGWDGTLNGNKLPSSDYWFIMERQNGKTYSGHFSLKR